MIKLKRIYEKPEKADGYRILVNRLWPRGISKARAALDAWLKEVAPSDELRKWYGHDPAKWAAFRKKYRSEIASDKGPFNQLKEIAKKRKNITLLFAAKDEDRNEAVVLKDLLS